MAGAPSRSSASRYPPRARPQAPRSLPSARGGSPIGRSSKCERNGARSPIGDDDRSRLRGLLEARGDVDGVARDVRDRLLPRPKRAPRPCSGRCGFRAPPQGHGLSFKLRRRSSMRRAARTARTASSSCTAGTPKTAIIASPTNFSIVPPSDSISARHRREVVADQARGGPPGAASPPARSSRRCRRRGRSRASASLPAAFDDPPLHPHRGRRASSPSRRDRPAAPQTALPDRGSSPAGGFCRSSSRSAGEGSMPSSSASTRLAS